ncbi:MAG: phosphatidylserine decarboxylase [bacterium]|jgi:phosphatidylserine decarboxylase|nr:phosphatidylserine decarboxylase [bacterium]
MIIHSAGHPPILRLLTLSVLLLVLGDLGMAFLHCFPRALMHVPGLLVFLAALFLMWFYRDPERRATAPPGALLAGADGRVIQVLRREHIPELGGPGTQVSIFMSPLDVHVNRVAAAGRVAAVDYRPGKYLMAFHEKSSELNEACLLVIEDEAGRRTAQRQIAGFLARRVVCSVEPGQRLERGQRYGIIKLGSRMDHFLPAAVRVDLRTGQRVKAGESILGEWT